MGEQSIGVLARSNGSRLKVLRLLENGAIRVKGRHAIFETHLQAVLAGGYTLEEGGASLKKAWEESVAVSVATAEVYS